MSGRAWEKGTGIMQVGLFSSLAGREEWWEMHQGGVQTRLFSPIRSKGLYKEGGCCFTGGETEANKTEAAYKRSVVEPG